MRTPAVQRVFREGRALHGDRIVVFVAPGQGGSATVAGRRLGGAVERNRARRILRAALRDVPSGTLDGCDVVIVAREPIRGARTQDVARELEELLIREAAGP